jgi:hypothetical protein
MATTLSNSNNVNCSHDAMMGLSTLVVQEKCVGLKDIRPPDAKIWVDYSVQVVKNNWVSLTRGFHGQAVSAPVLLHSSHGTRATPRSRLPKRNQQQGTSKNKRSSMFCVEMSPGRPQIPISIGFRHCLKLQRKRIVILSKIPQSMNRAWTQDVPKNPPQTTSRLPTFPVGIRNFGFDY